ncbi:MAG: AAA family ATPase [Methyloprofundus sp.]|nr:AAA family ATPase [Methyloprofundus sp.]
MKKKYLYFMGTASGAGKTTLCEGMLSQLLLNGYQPEQLAYIKPMTQCTDKQAVTVFCEQQHIAHKSIASLVFKKGFSKDFIDGLTKNSEILLQDILAEILALGKNKKLVIIDGVGGVSTGSVVGVSNVDIAHALAIPVLFVGKAGVGSTIDDTLLAMSFLQQQKIQNIALVYNKIPYSELISIQYYLTKRLAELLPNIPVLDFIADYPVLDKENKHQAAAKIYQWFNGLS